PSSKNARELIDAKERVATLGYSYKEARSKMSASVGSIRAGVPASYLLEYDASSVKKQSGGGIFLIENGYMRLAGIIAGELLSTKDHTDDTAKKWSPARSNIGLSVAEIFDEPDVKALIDADKAWWGKPNPALERMKLPLPNLQNGTCHKAADGYSKC
ncbi:hypothetical protein OY671_009225, partial [Metschnikowia pulcherrima]